MNEAWPQETVTKVMVGLALCGVTRMTQKHLDG